MEAGRIDPRLLLRESTVRGRMESGDQDGEVRTSVTSRIPSGEEVEEYRQGCRLVDGGRGGKKTGEGLIRSPDPTVGTTKDVDQGRGLSLDGG